MIWAFRILAMLNGLMVAAALLYQSPGEDPAGAGMRLGFAVFYAIALTIVIALYRWITARWFRIVLLMILALPIVSLAYGVALSV